MARANIQMPEDFLLKLSRLNEKTDEIVPKVLRAGGEVVLSQAKANLESVIGTNTDEESRSTGQLSSSMGVSPAKLDKNGNYDVKIGFQGKREDGTNNGLVAGVLEYGKHGQPPRPFMKPAKRKSKKACIEAMKQKFDEEVQNI